MIPTIGLMIGLYILARYAKMSQKAGLGARIVLAILSLVTIFCMGSLLVSSASIDTSLNPLTTGGTNSTNIFDSINIFNSASSIDSAKWSEAKSAMATIATCVRAYYAVQGCDTPAAPTLTNIGIAATDLDGPYFNNECYTLQAASCTGGVVKFNIFCTAANSKSSHKPTTPATMTLIDDGSGAVFSDGTTP